MHGVQNGDGYVLVQASADAEVSLLADLITRTPGVVKVERVHGPYDVIAVTHETDANSSPARAIGALDGVLRAIPLALTAADSSRGEAA